MAETLPSRSHQKAATLADVGREAGVSAMAASAVLNGSKTTARISDETRSRVLEAAERLRYRPDEAARALTSRRMNTIGVVATLLGSEPNLYFLELFNGVLRGAAAAGQNTTVFTLDGWDDAAQRIARFCDGRIDGLILVAPMLEDDPATWLPRHTPVVSIHANREIAGVVNLESDDEAGAFQATSRLLELGHRRILHVGGPVGSTGADRRVQGYRRAHEAAGVPLMQDPVVRDAYTFEAGRHTMESWLQVHRGEELPQAVFAGSDAIALGCIDALAARDLRVPADISVVGFDDTLLARTSRLATVRQPLQQLGRQATEILLSRMETRAENALTSTSANLVLPTEIVAGATMAPPRTAPQVIG
ncbi:LacI family DNA-binding transcriptional regulator [Ideonella sp. YS5]|uniref:LacI family DNA-binding transcriptional regulator n=1 Tax=Ideonella sp. YS5 TaxID=3453714 RepID=UPI003EECF0FC